MKKSSKLLILLALVCTLVVCCMVSASAAKEIVIDGVTRYTDDDNRYIYNNSSATSLIGISDGFDTASWEICGWANVDGVLVTPTYYGSQDGTPIYPAGQTFSKVNIMNKPDAPQGIHKGAFSLINCTGEFTIPESMFLILEGAFDGACIGSFKVDPDCQGFTNDDLGILYSHRLDISDGSRQECNRIIAAPNKTVEHYDIPDTIVIIDEFAFTYFEADTITVPVSLLDIGDNAFPSIAGSKFDAVYYEGTIDQWNEITIGGMNGRITKAHLFCNDWYTVSEQGCFTDEVERRDCHCSDDCGEYETRVIKEAFGSHNFTEQLGAVRSTCATQGYIEYHCSRCDRVKVYEPLDETNHEGPYEDCSTYIAPTCCDEGLEADKRCSACGVKTYTGVAIAPTGNHIYGEWYTTVEPTCCQTGVARRDCTVGEAYETTTVPATQEHNFGEWYQTIAATCAKVGEERRDCTVGNSYETRQIPVSDIHTFDDNWIVLTPADCGNEGTDIRYCTVCETGSETRVSPATGDHNWDVWRQKINPHCTVEGLEERICFTCKTTESRAIPVVSHKFYGETEVITEPTCYSEGRTLVKCLWYDECRETVTKRTTKCGHVYETFEVVTPATCISDGVEVAECKWYDKCKATSRNTLPATGEHVWETVSSKIVFGQCDKEGYKEYKCTSDPDCTEVTRVVLPIDPDYHNSGYNYDVNKKDATCCAEGYTGDLTCIGCNKVIGEGEVIPATGNHPGLRKSEKAGTCVKKGSISYYCTLSGKLISIEATTTDPNNHYVITVNYTPSSCTKKGYTGDRQCQYCDKIIEKGRTIEYDRHDVGANGKCVKCGTDVTYGCGHLCHKGGFWYKICLFFWKLFKTNKTCSCGMAHY